MFFLYPYNKKVKGKVGGAFKVGTFFWGKPLIRAWAYIILENTVIA